MDPISIAASLLTVLGAAATAGRALDHLSSLRHAPDSLIALVNEVSDLRVVLHNVRDAVQERTKTSQQCGNLSFIVQRASQKLSELNRLIYGNLLKTGGCNSLDDDDTIKASRLAFLRRSGKIKSLKDDIQGIKMSLLISMSTLTFSDVSRLKLDVCDVTLVASQQRQPDRPTRDHGILSTRTRGRAAQLSYPIPSPDAMDFRNLSNQFPTDFVDEKRLVSGPNLDVKPLRRASTDRAFLPENQFPFTGPNSQPSATDSKYSHIRVEASVSSVSYQHDRLCLCPCHQVTTMSSPGDWSKLLGRLFVGYTGTRIRVAYLFPFWFAWRLFALTITKASTSFMWKLDFPAVTQGSSDMFVHASLGNIEKIQTNKSTLPVALQFRQITTVSLLIEQGADMYLQDCNNKTPLDLFYENYFITTGEKRMEALLPIFERYDVFDHWNLRQVHLIILGWSSVDLITYLSVTPDEVDVFDSFGRTPLMWAAWRGDSGSVAILLAAGADPQATSNDGNSVLIYATYGGSLECMRLILETGADINHTGISLPTPAMGGSQLGDNPAIAKVRLERGAAIEASRHQKFTPLYVAALTNRVESLIFLLDRGASVDVKDWKCSTPLSMAISFSNYQMAEALVNRGADLSTAPTFTVSYLRNAAVVGDERMIRLFISARPAIDVGLKDAQGCTAEDRMKERLACMSPTDLRREGLAAAFKEFADACKVEWERCQTSLLDKKELMDYPQNGELMVQDEAEDDTFHDALEDQVSNIERPAELEMPTTTITGQRPPISAAQEGVQLPDSTQIDNELPTIPTTTQILPADSPQYHHFPTAPPRHMGVQTKDYAPRRQSPRPGARDTGHQILRSSTEPLPRADRRRWYAPSPSSTYSKFRQAAFPAKVQEVV
ncbi:MAG: hypothetical protein Q9218_006442 [Villophora microphyllina]